MDGQLSADYEEMAAHGDENHEAGSDNALYQTKGIKTFLIEPTSYAMSLRLQVKKKRARRRM